METSRVMGVLDFIFISAVGVLVVFKLFLSSTRPQLDNTNQFWLLLHVRIC